VYSKALCIVDSAVAVFWWSLHRLLARTTAPRPQSSTLPTAENIFLKMHISCHSNKKKKNTKGENLYFGGGFPRVLYIACFARLVLLLWWPACLTGADSAPNDRISEPLVSPQCTLT
jgi:hypothetical protein